MIAKRNQVCSTTEYKETVCTQAILDAELSKILCALFVVLGPAESTHPGSFGAFVHVWVFFPFFPFSPVLSVLACIITNLLFLSIQYLFLCPSSITILINKTTTLLLQ